MLVMEKDKEIYLFADYFLSDKINEGYNLINHIKVSRSIKAMTLYKGQRVKDYLAEQRRLLQQEEDEYKRKRKNRLAAIKQLEKVV